MLGLLLDIFQLILSSIYVRLCRIDHVTSEYTGRGYTYSEIVGKLDGVDRIMRFETRQISHQLNYRSRLKRSKIRYTYEVTLTEHVGERIIHTEVKTFPQISAWFMNHTVYPHLCAINAHMDLYRHWNRAQ